MQWVGIETRARKACLAEICRLWEGPGASRPPTGVWIAEHEPVPRDSETPTTPVVNAWFLDQRGIQPKLPDDFVRFMTVHQGTHWCSLMFGPPPGAVFNSLRPGGIFEI